MEKKRDKAFLNSLFTLSLPAFLLSVFFACFNIFLGIVTKSGWYYAVAIYFFAFSALRFTIVIYKLFVFKKTEEKELNLHIAIGIMFIILLIALSISIIGMMENGRPSALATFPAIIVAIHSSIKALSALRKLFKSYKKTNHLKRTIRGINLAETLVSLITLTVTLITTFGDGNLKTPLFIAPASILCALIGLIGLIMVIGGIKEKASLKKSRSPLSS